MMARHEYPKTFEEQIPYLLKVARAERGITAAEMGQKFDPPMSESGALKAERLGGNQRLSTIGRSLEALEMDLEGLAELHCRMVGKGSSRAERDADQGLLVASMLSTIRQLAALSPEGRRWLESYDMGMATLGDLSTPLDGALERAKPRKKAKKKRAKKKAN